MEFTDSGDILLLALKERPLKGRVLLVQPDSGLVGDVLRAQGCVVIEWSWIWSERSVVTWPERDVFDVVIVRLPVIRDLVTMALKVAASRLNPGGALYVYGSNQEGMKSIQDHLAPWFERPEVLLYKHRERVVIASRSGVVDGLRAKQADWEKHSSWELQGERLSFISYPGMFAHGQADPGTRLLLEHLPACVQGARVLDMGCGTGVLARAIQQRTPSVSIDAVDVNAFAVHATEQNVSGAKTFWGDAWNALPKTAKYDVIVSNPPVHRGAQQTTEVLENIISHAKEHLLPGGMITFVVQGTIPVKRFLNKAGLTPQLVAQDATYQIWSAC